MVNKEFEQFMQLCHSEVFEKQRHLTEIYHINKYKTYSFSQPKKELILKGEDELYFKYSEEFGNVLGQLEDYHGKIDYLASQD